MKRFGLIGHPVAGSFSPRLFEAAYGGRYPYDLIEGADFGVSWQRFLDDYAGINITAPFKEFAFRAVDALSDDARLCGAVNLAVNTPAGIVGYNTDVDGVVLAVREACRQAGLACGEAALGAAGSGATAAGATLASPDARPVIPGSPDKQPVIPGLTGNLLSKALVVGCGGAGRAAAVAALRLGCRVTLANRTPSRAAALADELNARLDPIGTPASTEPTGAAGSRPACTWVSVEDLPSLSPDLVIYTVPGPMDGFPEFPEAIVLEANYRTPCLKGCGRTYISGLRWLLFQAVAGYEIFTGETPDADAMFRIFC
jgi:shikimate 5-dehydrogenase